MKHLLRYKLFESTDKLYQRLTLDQFRESIALALDSNQFENFTPEELSQMKQYFPRLEFAFNSKIEVIQLPGSNRRKLSEMKVRIIKFIDEWFYVSIGHRRFKCDTFDGLIQLFKDSTFSNRKEV